MRPTFCPFSTGPGSSRRTADWPAEEIPAGRLETHGALLWPPLITAVLALAAGLFAAAPYSPLEWAQLIADREYSR